jgi:multimeric flavodoxin WrbA
MKKILVIFGGPRKKNTYEVVEKTEEEMKKLGGVEFEYLFLKEMDIKPCLGCFNCFIMGPEKCPLKDDRKMIEEKMHEANGVIFATPVFAMNMSGLMKTWLDRNAFMCHRPRFFDKPTMYIAVAGGVGTKETFKTMDIFQTWGFHTAVKLGLTAPPSKWKDSFKLERSKEIKKRAKEFHDAVNVKKIPDPGLNMVLFYYSFKMVISICPEDLPKDHQYWTEKGWLDKRRKYFLETSKVGPGKRLLASVMCHFIEKGMRKNFYVMDKTS